VRINRVQKMPPSLEWALQIHSLEEIQRYRTLTLQGDGVDYSTDRDSEFSALSVIIKALRCFTPSCDAVRFTRIYIGNEFCQKLIPAVSQLQRFLSFCDAEGLALSLLTPYVTDEGLQGLRPLLERLACGGCEAEVVVNDWGVLRLVQRDYPTLRVVLGRLMHRTLRDPRITGVLAQIVPQEIKEALSEIPSLTVPTIVRLLQRYHISLIECDITPQGINFPATSPNSTVGVVVHLPYGFTTTGRSCLIGSLRLPRQQKFAPGHPCALECREWLAIVRYHKNFGAAQVDRDLYQLGNTLFMRTRRSSSPP
jgi:hypothetical protein